MASSSDDDYFRVSVPATAYVRVEHNSGGTGPTSGAYRLALTG